MFPADLLQKMECPGYESKLIVKHKPLVKGVLFFIVITARSTLTDSASSSSVSVCESN